MSSKALTRSRQSTAAASFIPALSAQLNDPVAVHSQPSEDVLEHIALFCITPTKDSRAYYAPQFTTTSSDNSLQLWLLVCDQLTRKRALMQQRSWQRSYALLNKARWLHIAEKEAPELSFSEMTEIVTLTSLALKEQKFSEIDENLQIAEARKMCPDAITAVTRTLSHAKELLPHWKTFLQEAKAEMLRRGEPEDLMAGLG